MIADAETGLHDIGKRLYCNILSFSLWNEMFFLQAHFEVLFYYERGLSATALVINSSTLSVIGGSLCMKSLRSLPSNKLCVSKNP